MMGEGKNMERKVREEIDAITNIIVEAVPVEQVWLFGSYAYGTPNEESDLDFYVVMKDDAPIQAHEASTLIWGAVSGHKSIAADILVAKKKRFDYRLSAPTLEQEVAERGVLLYG
jgi:predicted nucleotidyltransferase